MPTRPRDELAKLCLEITSEGERFRDALLALGVGEGVPVGPDHASYARVSELGIASDLRVQALMVDLADEVWRGCGSPRS